MLHAHQRLKYKRLAIASVGENAKKLKPSHSIVGMKTAEATLENNLAIPEIVKHRVAI